MTFPSCPNYPEEVASFPHSISVVELSSHVLVRNQTWTKVEAALLISAISRLLLTYLSKDLILLMPSVNLHACPEWFNMTLKPILIQSSPNSFLSTKTSALNSNHVFDRFLVIPLACLII